MTASFGLRRSLALFVACALATLLSACNSGDATPTPTLDAPPTATSTPAATVVGEEPSPTPTATPTPAVALELLSPRDGAGIEIDAVRVFGYATPDAVVAVNGVPVEVRADGAFRMDLGVTPGGNLIEVTAVAPTGESTTVQRAVFGVDPAAALPLSLYYPKDGVTVDDERITIFGGSRQDAVVGINGAVATIDRSGLFEAEIPLDLGANFIEVVAADLNDNVSFRTVVVFRSE